MSSSSLLWSINTPEGVPSFLFGTMHIRDSRAHQFCHRLYPFIEQADVYVGEMDLNDMSSQPPGPVYDMKAFFRPGAYLKLKKQLLKSFGLHLDHYAHLHPLMIMSVLTQQVFNSDHAISIDEHLWHYAQDHNIVTTGLESVEEQVTLLHSIKPDKLYAQIAQMGARPGMIRKFTNRTLDYYLRGEIHGLYMLTKASMEHLRKRVIYERNERMTKRIIGFNSNQRYFIAVGAGHLSGAKGLISSLRRQGRQVKPVVY